jgi:hypothetical protein
MVAQRHKEIKEELTASGVHLELHGPAPFECVSTADDESQVVSSELGVRVGRVGVGVASRREDRAALDSGFCFSLVQWYIAWGY